MGSEPLGETAVGLDDLSLRGIDFSVYPNPSAGRFAVNLGKDFSEGTLTIFDELGRMIQSISLNSGIEKLNVDLGEVESGVYVIYINSPQGSGYKKLVVE